MAGFFDEIPQKTLESQVLDRLREAIVEGVFEPGSQINQVQVASHFGISRGPIRAALNKLEEEGLVINIPHRGTFVAPLDKKIVADVYGVRSVLEAYAVRLTISNFDDADLVALEEIYDAMQEAAHNNDLKAVVKHDFEMHKFFVEMSGNAVLMQSWSTLQIQVRRILSYRYFSHPYLQEMADSHTALLEQARRRNADEAGRLIEEHIMEACENILANWGVRVDESENIKSAV